MNFREMIEKEVLLSAFITNLLSEKPLALLPLEGGSSSVVYRAELRDGTARALKFSEHAVELQHEQLFLRAWSKKGVSTPDIFQYAPLPYGVQGGVLYMEHIAGQNLFPLMEHNKVRPAKVLHDLGSILATMHQVTANGYGQIVIKPDRNIEGKQKTFSETLKLPKWVDVVNANKCNGDLQDHELPLIIKAGSLLDKQRVGPGGCFVHGDFRAGNILYDSSSAQPYTVIDPKPAISHPYLCLAYSLILEEVHGKNNPLFMRQGYEAISPINDNVLHAASFLQALELLPRWGQKGQKYAEPLQQLFHREKAWMLKNRGEA